MFTKFSLLVSCLYLIIGCNSEEEITGLLDIPDAIFEYTAEGKGIPCVAFTGSENLGHRLYSEKFRQSFILIHADPSKLDSATVSNLTIDMILDDIEKLRKAINCDKISVIGHSMFGTLPLDYALKYPENIAYSISTGSRPFTTKKYHETVKKYWASNASDERKSILKKNIEEFSKLNLEELSPTQVFVESYTANIPKFCFDPQFDLSAFWGDTEINMNFLNHFEGVLMDDIDNTDKYKKNRTPTLIISGRHDYWAPYLLWDEIKSELPNFTFHVFDSSGHNPSIEIPEQFDELVIQWIKNK